MLIETYQGTLSIEQLTQKVWLSKRALEYQFQEQVGLSRKMYSRIKRFNPLLTAIKKEKVTDWQKLTFKCNYFDRHII